MSEDLFTLAVPDDTLEGPSFEPLPTGTYRTTLQPGAELASNDSGWKAVRLPFSGFRDTKSGKESQRNVRAQFTYESPKSAEAVRIGLEMIVGAAHALGLTEPTVTPEGKTAQKLTAANMEELVQQFNQMAGTEVEVYMTAQVRKRHGSPVLKADGTAFLDNEIKRVSAVK